MTSRDRVSSPFSPLLECPQVFRAAKESAVDGVGEERENYGATVGKKGGIGEQVSKVDGSKDVCTVSRTSLYTLYTNFIYEFCYQNQAKF